jgi:outer membrane protein assembly factor BamB
LHPSKPWLYVGQGIPLKQATTFQVVDLRTMRPLLSVRGLDGRAFRDWGSFDGSALWHGDSDTLFVGGENGLVYRVRLTTDRPVFSLARYRPQRGTEQGIENSLAAHAQFGYFNDNSGNFVCIDLTTLLPIWHHFTGDDSDASTVIAVEGSSWVVFTGTQVDKQGDRGNAVLRAFDGRTGRVIWSFQVRCLSVRGARPVNGGMMATPALGKGNCSDLIFATFARYRRLNQGLLVALNRRTGKEVWRQVLPSYAWSSPVDVLDTAGRQYVVQCTSGGDVMLFDGRTGTMLHHLRLGRNFEASPAVFDDMMVVGSRGNLITGIRIR